MPWAKLLADFIVVFHATYVSFVVFGLVLILLGIAFRWGWVRNFWFRALHLAAIGIVVLEAVVGMTCPLTDWEQRLRKMAGEGDYAGDFIGHWAHRLIFYRAAGLGLHGVVRLVRPGRAGDVRAGAAATAGTKGVGRAC